MRVIVVGAGIVGHAIAWELVARGIRVRMLDPRGHGQGATRASAGILAPHIEGHSPELLRLGIRSLEQYDGFVGRIAADAGQPVEYRRIGTLQVAEGEEGARRLEIEARAHAAAGLPHSLVDGREVRSLEPSLSERIRAGLLIPQHGYVGVASLMAALTRAAGRHGVTLTAARVRSIGQDGDSPRVDTSDGTYSADAVVIAAGSWSGGVAIGPGTGPCVRPIRGQLVHLKLTEPSLTRIVWGAEHYLVPWQDGTVLVGATVEDVGFDDAVTASGVRWLLEGAEAMLPGLAAATFEGARAGLRPATSDGLPIIGASSRMRGVYYATGHYRNGVLLAPLTAAMLADLIADGRARPELALARPDRLGL